MTSNNNTFWRCCYGYVVSGMAVLVVGAVLPSIMREAGLSFTSAGSMLSMMAVGNLMASLFCPILIRIIGKRLAITLTSALVPVSFFALTMLPGGVIIYLIFFAAGITRGSITIINNTIVNVISNNSNKALNLLHCSFAVGAFLAPFLTSLLIAAGLGWRSIVYIIVILCASSALSYALMDYGAQPAADNNDNDVSAKPANSNAAQSKKPQTDYGFLKQPMFYCVGLILFFYLGTENCINGWFVTYLQNTGVMSESYATNMISVTWLVIMLGRLVNASLSKKYNKNTLILINSLGSCCFFFLLISQTHLALITIALLGLGFFLSGIYPACMARGGQFIKGSTMGMACLTAISSLGGIITPQLVGSAADRTGIVGAIGLLSVNAVMVVVFALVNFRKRNA